MSNLEQGAHGPAWKQFVARHGVGDVVDGQVTEVAPFGAFIRVEDGFDGLLVGEDRPEPGATVSVKIAEIDHAKRRMKFVTP
jgi:ribosomal protein S1